MLYVRSNLPESETGTKIEKESLMEFLFHDAPEAIFILEPKGYTIIDCNKRAMELFETSTKSSLISLPSFRLYDSEPNDFSRNLPETSVQNEGEYSQELAFRTLRQNVFWGKLTKRVFRSNDRELLILRISKAGENLRAEETISALLRGTAKVTGYKFFKELTNLLCQTFNVSYAFVGKISGKGKVLNILESTGSLHLPDRISYELEGSMMENVLNGYTTFYPNNVREMFPGDKFVQTNNIRGFMGTPVFGGSGEVIGVIGFTNTKAIDEVPNSRYILSIFASRTAAELQRIRSKEILKEQARSLSQSNMVKDKLLSVISHDLINPLHTIMGFSELLRSKVNVYDKEKIVERVEIIDNSIRNIYFMLDNLNAWSTIYREKLRPNITEINLRELVNENISLFKFIIEIKRFNLSVNIDEQAVVNSDQMMLNTIIRNILSNAVKYTPKKGSITITASKEMEKTSIRISDNGAGIAEGDLMSLNLADCNVPEVNLVYRKGTGLGLILSKNYTERLGGSLIVESTHEVGTEVELILP
jgi:signal transduction histidine kinase